MRDEAGSGLVDVMIGFLIFTVVIAMSAVLMRNIGTAGANVQANQQAITTAESVLSQERAFGCGAATGYGTSAGAQALLTSCTFGQNKVQSYGDWTGATYNTGAFTEVVSAHNAWGWSSGGPSCAMATGTPVAAPPNELTRVVQANWRDHHIAGATHSRVLTYVSSTPAVLMQGWQVGGLGGIAVQASAGTPVSLSVPGWPAAVQTDAQAGGCAWFPYVPAAGGYSVSVGGTVTQATVAAGQWTVVQ